MSVMASLRNTGNTKSGATVIAVLTLLAESSTAQGSISLDAGYVDEGLKAAAMPLLDRQQSQELFGTQFPEIVKVLKANGLLENSDPKVLEGLKLAADSTDIGGYTCYSNACHCYSARSWR